MKGKYENVYVLAPYNGATGGIELCHQLVDCLRNKGQNAYIVYVKNNTIIVNDCSVTEAYQKYNIKVASHIDDNEKNFLVLPETYFDFVLTYKRIKIGAWWMSVDNRYNRIRFLPRLLNKKGFLNKLQIINSKIGFNRKYYVSCLNDNKLLKKEGDRIVHFYQSHYAQSHLYQLGFSWILPLSDYINTSFGSSDTSKKDNIVLYNPIKGSAYYVNNLIKLMPQVKFIALRGLSREQLNDLFFKAKIYIDFGKFPGKDRLFREAALNNCCILTGKFGASYFYEDVPIFSKYKFDMRKRPFNIIKKCIYDILDNYDERVKDFSFLIKKTKNEIQVFNNEVDQVFFV